MVIFILVITIILTYNTLLCESFYKIVLKYIQHTWMNWTWILQFIGILMKTFTAIKNAEIKSQIVPISLSPLTSTAPARCSHVQPININAAFAVAMADNDCHCLPTAVIRYHVGIICQSRSRWQVFTREWYSRASYPSPGLMVLGSGAGKGGGGYWIKFTKSFVLKVCTNYDATVLSVTYYWLFIYMASFGFVFTFSVYWSVKYDFSYIRANIFDRFYSLLLGKDLHH